MEGFAGLSHLLEEGYESGVYTAAAALVGREGELLWQGTVGRLSREAEAPPVTPDTVFDLASLTKPLATALAVLRLVEQGPLGLKTTLGEVLPAAWLPADKNGLTLTSLLAHRSGLPAWRPYYQDLLAAPPEERPSLPERLAAATPLEHPPDTVTLYSDLGFMLLKAVVEAASGENLDDWCRRELYRPLGLQALGYRPLEHPGGRERRYAHTEPGLIPGRTGVGEVHDENAWAAGGVAGHAGLFGTGPQVFHLAAQLFRSYRGASGAPFPQHLVRRFFTPVAPGARALGFDVPGPDPDQRSMGRFFSEHTVGHLGFTGASLWMDLTTGLMVVLLTNRVHLGRDNDKIRPFRPRFHEAVCSALGLGRVPR
ncbi:MAG: beta-lactamase family protein [Deltaproteobacteria bacterium]|nr:beta-lactamase family protein [Deltaproteobacteria bacterium]